MFLLYKSPTHISIFTNFGYFLRLTMSRQFNNWSRPEKRPRRKQKDRDRTYFVPRPENLRGKEIGLYYRNLQRKKKTENCVIKLTIPQSIMKRAYNEIQVIKEIAIKENIVLPEKSIDWSKVKKDKDAIASNNKIESVDTESELEMSTSDLETKDSVIKSLSNSNDSTVTHIRAEPSTSSAPDFIPIDTHVSTNYNPDVRKLSLGGGGDYYKYSYQDIITGTFEEKLEESLSKGVAINMTNSDINELNVSLYEEYKNMSTNSKYKSMLKFREQLPTYKKSKEILNILENNQVIVISGETGCGKSTQVPQIILDDALHNKKGANVNIMVTEPRRIAASSLAMRVAEERAEQLGQSVGYVVRLEKEEARPRGSIIYCTTGILLADVEINQGLTNYSHIILDEVHERDTHIDLSMCMLKQVLKKRKDLKLILMSATIDAERLSAYYDNCPIMHIQGRAYPVHEVYLEEILQMTKFTLQQQPVKNHSGPKWLKYKHKGRNSREMRMDIEYKAEIAPWLESIKKTLDREVYKTLQDQRIEMINTDLIVELLIYISKGEPGAILVFLPGIGDITKLMRKMEESNAFPKSRYEIYPLHSKLATLQQRKIFQRPPENVRKIIIATNIAETSITIDDIVYVIDSGRIKISGLNVEQNISTLKTEWISQANLRQRRGRAGRCQPGICYHLVTSYRAETLAKRLLPELQRSNLLESVLTMKKLRLGKAGEALKMVPDPPAESTVEWAVKHLQQCGALDGSETLTPLGWHLARLPVHPAAGKLLLFGALFGCLNRAATVAAIWGFKDPFQLVIGKEKEVEQVKRSLTLGEPSDHIASSEAVLEWESRDYRDRRKFAYDHFLSNDTLQLLSDMKIQLGDNLKQMGFSASGDIRGNWENRNAYNMSAFKAIVAAALYPNIATVRWIGLEPRSKKKNIRVIARTPEGRVSIHPSSVMATPNREGASNRHTYSNTGANWLVYWLKQRSSDLFLIDVTLVYTLPLLFFGELRISDAGEEDPEDCFILISTIKVRCKKDTAEMLFKLRSLLDQVLASKIMASDSTRHSEFEERVLKAVMELITAEDIKSETLEDYNWSQSETSD